MSITTKDPNSQEIFHIDGQQIILPRYSVVIYEKGVVIFHYNPSMTTIAAIKDLCYQEAHKK